MQVGIDIPSDASGWRLVMQIVPIVGMMMVMVIVPPFITAGQRESDSRYEEADAKHVLDRVLHKCWFWSILFLKPCQTQTADKQIVNI